MIYIRVLGFVGIPRIQAFKERYTQYDNSAFYGNTIRVHLSVVTTPATYMNTP